MRNLAPRAFASVSLAFAMAVVPFPASSAPDPGLLRYQLVASGLDHPCYVTSPPGDSSRLFVIEQPGTIRIVKDGVVLPAPFLDVTSDIIYGGEQGLLCIVFHPQFASNGEFFVTFNRVPDGAVCLARYHVSADPDVADASSAELMIATPLTQDFHNGGMLAFGPNDGYLYISVGDGGSGIDEFNPAQDIESRLGKMLRIDVNTDDPTQLYRIPPDNPFWSHTPGADEIWALGFRNPWRFSFDRKTGDLFIGDVGQGDREEIDFQPAGAPGGANYGWPCVEGDLCGQLFPIQPPCACPSPFTPPIHAYDHTSGCAVIGGFVYRGAAIPWFQGSYLFGDACYHIWSFNYDGVAITNFKSRREELDPGPASHTMTSMGEDAAGELYVVFQTGEVFKVVAAMGATVGGPPGRTYGGGGGGCR